MNTVAEHYDRARQNRDLAALYEARITERPEWTVVIRFYSALHFLDAYLVTKEKAVENHGERKRAIRRLPELSSGPGSGFRRAYYWLQDRSEQVRYDAGYSPPDDLTTQSASKLQTVERVLDGKIARALQETE